MGGGLAEPFTPYQRRLLAFLSVATFFEGYDLMALGQILPTIRVEMSLTRSDAGLLFTGINIGAVLAYFLVRKADQWGRKTVLAVTIAGYTLATLFTGLSTNIVMFAVCQLFARFFLIAEYATSMIIASEEFPAERRGMAMGTVSGFAVLGAVTCAGVVPMLLQSEWGWRTVYFVGVLPLLGMAYLRRGLKETAHFEAVEQREAPFDWLHIWRTPYRARVIQMGAIWFLAYVTAQNLIAFWKDFAMTERGLTSAESAKVIVLAATVSIVPVFLTGKLVDVIGRRRGAVVVFVTAAVGSYASYSAHGFWPLTVAMVLGVYAASAFLPVLTAFTTELFPTELRGDAFAWSNNLIGRSSWIISPVILGNLAEVYGWGPTMSATAFFPLLSLALILLLLPETRALDIKAGAPI